MLLASEGRIGDHARKQEHKGRSATLTFLWRSSERNLIQGISALLRTCCETSRLGFHLHPGATALLHSDALSLSEITSELVRWKRQWNFHYPLHFLGLFNHLRKKRFSENRILFPGRRNYLSASFRRLAHECRVCITTLLSLSEFAVADSAASHAFRKRSWAKSLSKSQSRLATCVWMWDLKGGSNVCAAAASALKRETISSTLNLDEASMARAFSPGCLRVD